jgi:NUMOD3 motif.
MSEARVHYVYRHRRESDGTVFYYGKGKDRRAWSASGRNRHWRGIARKHGWTVEIVRSDMPEPCALSLERALIERDRGPKLANLTDGGGGTPGWKHSEETKRRIGAHWKGREFTPKMREALALANKNRVLTDAQRARMSEAAKRRARKPHTPETRAKIAASHIGLRPTDEARRNMSLAKIGKCVGRDSPTYDHTIRHFVHSDGSEFIGTRGDFILKFCLRDGCVSAVISGRQKSVKGWKLK